MRIRGMLFREIRAISGFGVIEVLVSVAIGMIGIVGVGAFLSHQAREVMLHTQKYEVAEMKSSLHSALMDSATCKTILNGMTDPFSPGAVINLPRISIPKYSLNLVKTSAVSDPISNSSSGLKLKSLRFKVDSLISNAADQYLGTFEIQVESSGQSFNTIKSRKIVKVNALGRAENCVAELNPSCPVGEFYSGMDSSGLPICISLSCPTGKVAQGISSTGAVICVDDRDITQKAIACLSDEFLSGVNSSGSAICSRIPATAQPPPSTPPVSRPDCTLDFIGDQGDGWDFPSSIPSGQSSVSGTKTRGGCIPTTSVCIGSTLTFSLDTSQGQRHFFVASAIKGVQGRNGEVVYRCP